MVPNSRKRLLSLATAIVVAVAWTATANAQGTAFTYQGRLKNGGIRRTGTKKGSVSDPIEETHSEVRSAKPVGRRGAGNQKRDHCLG